MVVRQVCRRSQVADAAPHHRIARVAGALPEGGGYIVVVGDERGDTARTAVTQLPLAGLHQRQSDAAAAMGCCDSEAVHVPAPTVPGNDQRTHDLSLEQGDENAPRLLGEQTTQVLGPVGRTRVLAAGAGPQAKDS
jgi:hypothetical protein